jgi:hypothetical protein
LNAHPLVLVTWEDASVVDEGTWADRHTAPKAEPIVFQQVGWLLEATADHVVLTACMSADIISARDRIPRGMVRSIHTFDPAFGELYKLPRKRKRT